MASDSHNTIEQGDRFKRRDVLPRMFAGGKNGVELDYAPLPIPGDTGQLFSERFSRKARENRRTQAGLRLPAVSVTPTERL